MSNKNIAIILTYLGITPFIFFTIFNDIHFLDNINSKKILIAYSSIIISFIAGMTFSLAINSQRKLFLIIILTNGIALLSWITIFLDFYVAIIISQILFITVFLIENFYLQLNIKKKWFYKLRIRITFLVIIVLSFNLF